MEYTRLGKSGLKVSRLCLGMMTYGSPKWHKWVLDEEQALPFVKRALEAGINFFDTADMYSLGASEEVLGNTLRTCGARRESVVIATKVFNQMSEEVNDRGVGNETCTRRDPAPRATLPAASRAGALVASERFFHACEKGCKIEPCQTI
jgi:1-deoxyxylulose-5-phosphate synthase